MGVISTGLSTAGLRSEFFNRFEMTPSVWADLCTRIASTKDQETYRWLGTVPRMREWGTGRLAKGLRTESYSVENLKYEATLEVDRDEISDDQTGQIRVRVQELAVAAAQHKDKLLGALFEAGATSGYNSYDGVTFFNAAHSSGDSGSQDNDLTHAAATSTTPTTAEFKDSLVEAIAAMMAFKDDQGEPIGITPTGLAILVPPALYYTALEAVSAAVIGSTTNVLAAGGPVAQVRLLPFLTTAYHYYLCKTDGVVRPFVFQDREPVQFDALAEGSEEEFRRDKYLYGVRARYRLTYGYWQYCLRMVFT